MDLFALQKQVVDLLTTAPSIGADGKVTLPDGFAQTRAALQACIDAAPDATERADYADLARAMDDYAQSASKAQDPGTAAPPLVAAIDAGDIAAVRAALPTADVNMPHGVPAVTPLSRAMSASTASLEIMTLLLDAGADPTKGHTGANVLHALARGSFPDVTPEDLALIIKRCTSLGADLEERSQDLQRTPLLSAASEWNPIAVEALLLAGADIDATAGGRASDFAKGSPETSAILKRFAEVPDLPDRSAH